MTSTTARTPHLTNRIIEHGYALFVHSKSLLHSCRAHQYEQGNMRSPNAVAPAPRVFPSNGSHIMNQTRHREPEIIEVIDLNTWPHCVVDDHPQPYIYEHEVWNEGEDTPEVYYYIIPGGLNVIFWDEFGNEITR